MAATKTNTNLRLGRRLVDTTDETVRVLLVKGYQRLRMRTRDNWICLLRLRSPDRLVNAEFTKKLQSYALRNGLGTRHLLASGTCEVALSVQRKLTPLKRGAFLYFPFQDELPAPNDVGASLIPDFSGAIFALARFEVENYESQCAYHGVWKPCSHNWIQSASFP